ncbi:MAG: leucine-rich repeat domain-containing protein [Treponema sp.]|nr:leucine-rich repeat domain-containing protein [Treponema sp.]
MANFFKNSVGLRTPLVFFLIAAFTMNAEAQLNSSQQYDNENDFVVETVGDNFVARITGYNGEKAEIRIPKQIRRMTIVAIGERAFYKKGFTGVTIPNSVILIGNGAFSENNITKITIGTNVMIHENSFDMGFAGFYSRNGCRAGTYIFSDNSWIIQTVTEPPPNNETVSVETPKTAKGFDLEPYAGFSVGIGLLDYGPSSLIPRLGLHLGLLTSIGSFSIGITGEGGGFLGMAYPVFEDIGITYGFYFGSFMEIYYSGFIGFGLGGGMTRGYFTTKNDMGEKYFFPFAELDILFGDQEDSISIFFRYYINDSDNFYNKFSVGIKKKGF